MLADAAKIQYCLHSSSIVRKKRELEARLIENLKKYVREFSLLHGDKIIYTHDGDNTKTLFDCDLNNGDKILIQSHPILEKRNFTILNVIPERFNMF